MSFTGVSAVTPNPASPAADDSGTPASWLAQPQPIAPESAVATHPLDQGCQRLRLRAVVGPATLASVLHQAGELQHAQVLGRRRLRDAGPIGQGAHGLLADANQALEDCAAVKAGASTEYNVGYT